eukprot:Nk52_evm37s1524 gene=Nk52_evmTU37s1524
MNSSGGGGVFPWGAVTVLLLMVAVVLLQGAAVSGGAVSRVRRGGQGKGDYDYYVSAAGEGADRHGGGDGEGGVTNLCEGLYCSCTCNEDGSIEVKDCDELALPSVLDSTYSLGDNVTKINMSGVKLTRIDKGFFFPEDDGYGRVDMGQSLRELDLSNNLLEGSSFTEEVVSRLVNLHTLHLQGNKLKFEWYQFLSAHNLESLDLSENTLGNQDLLGTGGRGINVQPQVELDNVIMLTSKLRILRLRKIGLERVSMLNLQELIRLEELSLADNPGMDLDKLDQFSGFLALKHMDVSGCNLPKPLVSYNMPSLISADMSRNAFTEIGSFSLKKNNKLKRLDLSFNKISRLDNQTFYMKDSSFIDVGASGVLLNLSHNQIQAVSAETFSGTSFETIDLSFNDLKELPGNLFANTIARNINMSHNSIETLRDDTFNGLNLTYLDLSWSTISKVEDHAFRGLRVDYLDLSFNELYESMPLGKFPSYVREIKISHNQLYSVQLYDIMKALPMLKTFDCSHNNLTFLRGSELSGDFHSSLETLDVSSNPISPECFDNKYELPLVTHLYLRNISLNNISSSHMKLFPKLKLVDLSFNSISEIPTDAFRYNSGLETVLLDHNELREVSSEAFAFNSNTTKHISFAHNRIEKIIGNDSFSEFTKLEMLDFSYNNLSELPGRFGNNVGHLGNGCVFSFNYNNLTAKSFSIAFFNSHVRALSFRGNSINELPSIFIEVLKLTSCPCTVTLDFTDNGVTSLDTFFDFQRILPTNVALVVANNMIKTIPDDIFRESALLYLDVSHNLISTLPIVSKENNALIGLNLEGNAMTSMYKYNFTVHFPNMIFFNMDMDEACCDMGFDNLASLININAGRINNITMLLEQYRLSALLDNCNVNAPCENFSPFISQIYPGVNTCSVPRSDLATDSIVDSIVCQCEVSYMSGNSDYCNHNSGHSYSTAMNTFSEMRNCPCDLSNSQLKEIKGCKSCIGEPHCGIPSPTKGADTNPGLQQYIWIVVLVTILVCAAGVMLVVVALCAQHRRKREDLKKKLDEDHEYYYDVDHRVLSAPHEATKNGRDAQSISLSEKSTDLSLKETHEYLVRKEMEALRAQTCSSTYAGEGEHSDRTESSDSMSTSTDNVTHRKNVVWPSSSCIQNHHSEPSSVSSMNGNIAILWEGEYDTIYEDERMTINSSQLTQGGADGVTCSQIVEGEGEEEEYSIQVQPLQSV